ncbi:RNA polymerase sigma factor [Acidipila sp. EB88]|nr:RNA polymerase sigma factor [Acidipila sp. EB88]
MVPVRRSMGGHEAQAAGAHLPVGAVIGASGTRGQVEQDWIVVVGRCLQGDSLAWTELVRAHHGRVYSLCYRFTNSSHDAEDLCQDIFLKVYGSLKSFDPGRGSLTVWVTTMTRNHLVDHYRRSRLERASDSLDAGWDETGEEQRGGVRLEDTRPGPHENVLQRELAQEVQAALAQVSPELREAVILRDLQDLDYKEIATVLRVPEGTVKSRISRGRAELARVLSRKGKQVS